MGATSPPSSGMVPRVGMGEPRDGAPAQQHVHARSKDAHDLSDVIIKNMAEGVCLVRVADATIVYANPKFEQMLAYDPGELEGKPVSLVNFPDESATAEHTVERILEELNRSGEAVYEVRNVKKDGVPIWCRAHTSSFNHPTYGAVWVAVHEDITDQKTFQEERDRFFDLSNDMLCISNFDGWFERVNPAWESAVGWTAEEMRSRPYLQFVHPDDQPAALVEREKLVLGHPTTFFENRFATKDGGYRWLQWKSVPYASRRLIFGSARDVTWQKQSQQKLAFADRMASLGTLAAGAAHEINNPLAVIRVNVDLMVDELAEARALGQDAIERLRKLAEDARQGEERIRRIVRGLQAFARMEPVETTRLDVRRVVELAVDVAFSAMSRRAKLVKEFRRVPPVDADETRLTQVIANLLMNAAYAMGERDRELNEIKIVTRTDEFRRAVVEVIDNGEGISAENLPRVFDPFFTTKPLGVGTGLGLSVCHGIVNELGGKMNIESEPGRGTRVTFALPPASTKIDETERFAASENAARVLVIDDDDTLANLIERMLTGNHVTIVRTAQEAIDILQQGERYDVILCDVMLPGMTGMELYRELSRERPDQLERIVFMTGGVFSDSIKAFLEAVGNERLQKPFPPEKVRALVRRFSARPPPASS